MEYDELELDTLGEEKTALFVIISDTDATFNFVVSIMYSQLFREKVMQDINNAMKHLDDEDMIELSLRVVEKLKGMSDEEFAELDFIAAE